MRRSIGIAPSWRILRGWSGSCGAPSVAKQSNDEILKATAFADGLVENREAVKLAIFGAVFAFFNLIGWRILTTSTNPKVEKIAAFFNL